MPGFSCYQSLCAIMANGAVPEGIEPAYVLYSNDLHARITYAALSHLTPWLMGNAVGERHDSTFSTPQ